MNQSENIAELAKSLSLAQGEMQAAIKDSVNPFFKSKYADLGSVWDAARPVLSKNGLCIMQTTEMSNDKIIMVTTLAHISGQWVKSFLPLNPSKNDSQGIGSALTYLRRYSLSALVGVVCDEDDDGETSVGRGKVQKSQPNASISNDQWTDISKMMNKLDDENRLGFIGWAGKEYKCDHMKDLPVSAYDRCMTVLNAKVKMLEEKRVA